LQISLRSRPQLSSNYKITHLPNLFWLGILRGSVGRNHLGELGYELLLLIRESAAEPFRLYHLLPLCGRHLA
jgi:hypothetical protein